MKTFFTHKGKPYNLANLAQKWDKEENGLMPELGMIGVNFFQDRFRARAWTDKRAEKWKPRKKKDKGRGKRALLVKSGALRNSIHVKSSTLSSVIISTPKKYAAVHNFGFNGTVKVRAHSRRVFGRAKMSNIKSHRRSSVKFTAGTHRVKAHTRKMNIPQRQFMGYSNTLHKKFVKAIFRRIDKTFEL